MDRRLALVILVTAALCGCSGGDDPVNSSDTVVVNGSGLGDYTTIQGAVDGSGPGTRIMIYPGVFEERVREMTDKYGFESVSEDDHLDVPCDIYSPCARGAGLNDATIARLPLAERGVIGHEPDAPWDYLREREVVMFDALNRLVQRSDAEVRERGSIVHDGREMRLVAIPVGDVFLTFATPLDDAELERVFVGLDLP